MGPSLRFLLMACMLAGCTSEPTQLLLFVDTDIPVTELNRVFVHVTAPEEIGTETTMEVRTEDLPLMVALQSEGNTDSEIVLNVIGRNGGADVLARRVRMRFVPNKTHFATIVLSDDCKPASITCDPTLTCDGGACKTDVLPTEEWRGIRPISVQVPDAGPMDGGSDAGPDAPVLECPIDCWAGCVTPGTCDEVRDFALGGDHTCALTNAGRVFCWGRNNRGQLGHEPFEDSVTPRAVGGDLAGKVVTQITAGLEHTCASDGSQIWCWGSNDQLELGVPMFEGEVFETATPTAVIPAGFGDATVVALEAGAAHTCASITDPSSGVYCWGSNAEDRLGVMDGLNRAFGMRVAGFGGHASHLALGTRHGCGINADRKILCWGDIRSTTRDSATAGPPVGGGFLEAQAIEANSEGTCAQTIGLQWVCWGQNEWGGLLGLPVGPLPNTITPPEAVMPPSGISPVEMTMGCEHSCIVDETNRIHCYGLAVGVTAGSPRTYSAITASAVPPVIRAGGWDCTVGGHTCVILDTSSVPHCWGNNEYGQSGQEPPANFGVPTPVPEPVL